MNGEEKEAVRRLTSALLAVEPHLRTPYPDDDRWTPWTRFVEVPLERLFTLAYPSYSDSRSRSSAVAGSTQSDEPGGAS